MMRSMYTGVTGLRTHQQKMDTIGNNIANVNTTGFKRGQVTFKDTFNQMLTGSSAPSGGRGGINPMQVGMGVTTGGIKTIHTPGAGMTTDDPLDLMIEGNGFFTVSNDASFNNRYYTRNGSFSKDAFGNITTADGYKVLGYNVGKDGKIDTSEVVGMRVNESDTLPAETTKNVYFQGNFDSNTNVGDHEIIDTQVYDSLGNSYKLSFKVTKGVTDDKKETTWDIELNRVTDMGTGNYVDAKTESDSGGKLPEFKVDIKFDSSGNLISVGDKKPEETDFGKELDINGLKFNKDSEGNPIKDSTGNDITGGLEPEGTFGENGKIKIFDRDNEDSYDKLTQYANESNAKPYRKDGHPSGSLDSFSVGGDGKITGVFTNGEQKVLGQLLLTKFDNPMGLEKVGNTMFIESNNSGEAQSGMAGTGGIGMIRGGTLEMSNVDISYEFTEMITTQRGFQANSRIITTSDEMLQELVNIKR